MAGPIQNGDASAIDFAIGTVLREMREERGLSARQLSDASCVSAAMVSRIENGQVSPSISTLSALATALDVPLAGLFRETASPYADSTHVRKGAGLKSTRRVDGHSHEYINLAFHRRRDLQFEAHLITLERQSARPPVYVGQGTLFIYVLKGKAEFGYGHQQFVLEEGDSLSIDAELGHGFRSVLTPEFTFLSVQAERR